jgi:hypothetical protein
VVTGEGKRGMGEAQDREVRKEGGYVLTPCWYAKLMVCGMEMGGVFEG